MESYKELIAYQKGYKLALEIYKTTKDYPKEEIYGLVSQMRRSSVQFHAILRKVTAVVIVRNISSFFIRLRRRPRPWPWRNA